MNILKGIAIALPLFGQPITIYPGSPIDTGYSSPPGITTTAYTVPNYTPVAPNVATMRYGTRFTYHLTVSSPGMYTVTLSFIEPCTPASCGGWIAAAGQRVFSVTANDQPIIQNLDLFAENGALTPTARAALLVIPGTDLYLTFTASVRNAVISAIAISSDLTIGTPVVTGLLTCTSPPGCAGMLYGTLSGAGYWLIPVSAGFAPNVTAPSTWATLTAPP